MDFNELNMLCLVLTQNLNISAPLKLALTETSPRKLFAVDLPLTKYLCNRAVPTQSPRNPPPVFMYTSPRILILIYPGSIPTHFAISTLGRNSLCNRAVSTQSSRNPHANVALQLAPRKMVPERPFPTQISDLAWVCETGVSLWSATELPFFTLSVV